MAAAVVTVAAGGLFLAVKSPARDRLLAMAGVRGGAGEAADARAGTDAGVGRGDRRRERGGRTDGAGRAPVNPPSEFRVSIYRDALDMIRDQPWTGTGLGTFAGVFPQYRRASLVTFNAVHPESDWLMLMAECGVPAFACAAGLVALAGRRLAGLGEHPYWPLRWGCAAAALAAVMHSAVDVPAHREAMGWWMLALGGLALQRPGATGGGDAVGSGKWNFNAEARRTRRLAEKREEEEKRPGGGWQRGVFVLGGVGALVLGGWLVRAEWFQGEALPPFAAAAAPQRMFEAYQKKEYAAGTVLARRMLRGSPLNPSTYYYLGIFLAVSDEEGVDQQVDEMFQAERVLDPVMPDVPQHQSMAWAGYDPARQTALTMAELGRVGRINRALGIGWTLDHAYYQDLVTLAAAQPDVQRYLLAITQPDRRFEEAWARVAPAGMVQSRVERLAADPAETSGSQGGSPVVEPDWYLQPESAGPVLPARTGGRGEPPGGWGQAAWAVRLRQRVYAGQYREAVNEVGRRYGIALGLPGTGGSDEGAAGAFVAAWRGGDEAGARRGLAVASVDVNDPAALEVWRWQAALAAHDSKWKEAWLLLERYVRHTRQTEWP